MINYTWGRKKCVRNFNRNILRRPDRSGVILHNEKRISRREDDGGSELESTGSNYGPVATSCENYNKFRNTF
jgi:hypothetical protein